MSGSYVWQLYLAPVSGTCTVNVVRGLATALVVGLLGLSACGDDDTEFEVAVTLDEQPGDVISLRADGDVVEYISRRDGEIRAFNPALVGKTAAGQTAAGQTATGQSGSNVLAVIEVSTDGEQRGLLGHTVIDGRRFAAWTDPESRDLIVGDVTSGGIDRIVWQGTGTQSTAIGGHLDSRGGLIVLGLGSLTDWAKDNGSGALVTLDPDGPPNQEPVVISNGWNNPFAFAVVDDEFIWVADNSPDGSDLAVEDRQPERIATAEGNGPGLLEPPPQRAPSAIVQLPDGRYGVCGFLDNEMRSYEIGPDDALERAGTIGPCLTGATVLADGSIVTASTSDDGDTVLLIRSP